VRSLLLLLLPIANVATSDGNVVAMPSEPATAARTLSAFFVCTGGHSIRAVFNNGSRPRVELTLSDGRYVVLPQAKSGSGARYANQEESFVFWNKGQTAFIVERGKTTYAGCEKQDGS
jgi:membrane-bound inhibitor of C-type lysozyme